jgi:hypothetical protein
MRIRIQELIEDGSNADPDSDPDPKHRRYRGTYILYKIFISQEQKFIISLYFTVLKGTVQ